MPTWEVKGPVKGMAKSWRDLGPQYRNVERVKVPKGRDIAHEGAEIWAYKERPKNLGEMLDRTVEKFPDREAFVLGEERLTWKEFGERVNNMAVALQDDFAVKKGDRVAFLVENRIEFAIGYYATTKIGAIVVPHNIALSSEALLYQINHVKPIIEIASPGLWSKIDSIRGKITSVKNYFIVGDEKKEGTLPFLDLIEKEAKRKAMEEVDEWDPAGVIFTSGTTGTPKASVAMHLNIINNAMNAANVLNLNEEDTNIIMVPFFHVTSLHSQLAPDVFSGTKSVIMSAFNPKEALGLIGKEKITTLVGAPVMLWLMMIQPDFEKFDVSSLKKIGYGGSAASPTYVQMLSDKFPGCIQVNAGSITESTSLSYALPPEDSTRKRGSVGLSAPASEITVFDEDGSEITEYNKIGELAFKGALTNRGYWEDPDRTRETFRKDGYVLSGDLAKVDEDGYLWIMDRKKDMVIRGGQNVYCVGVESELYGLDKIMDVGVVGVPDRVFTERVKAIITLKPGQKATVEEIEDYAKEHLTKYEVPEYVVFTDAIPHNPGGKIVKAELADLWGEMKEEKDPTIAKYKGFYQSMVPKLKETPIILVDETTMTPKDVSKHLEQDSDMGKKIRKLIEKEGAIALVK